MSAPQITDHSAIALSQFLQQYNNSPSSVGIAEVLCGDIQDLENALFGIPALVTLANASGVQLDGIGTILNMGRNGASDGAYRGILLAKIAQNVSKGTPENVIAVFKTLMGANYVDLVETEPAEISLTAIGGAQITDNQSIKNAVNATRPAAVGAIFFASGTTVPFVFLGDHDPNGQGFGNSFDSTVGGTVVDLF